MTQATVAHEVPDPIGLGPFRQQAVVHVAKTLTHLVQQALGVQRGLAGRRAGFGRSIVTVHNNRIAENGQ